MTLSASRDRVKGTVTVRMTCGSLTAQAEEQDGHVIQFWHELGKLVAAEDNEKRAEAGYERYVAHCGGVSVHGEPLPAWRGQDETVKGHWIAAFTE